MLGVSQRGQDGQANDGGWAGGKRACKTAVQGAGLVRAVVLVLGAEQCKQSALGDAAKACTGGPGSPCRPSGVRAWDLSLLGAVQGLREGLLS